MGSPRVHAPQDAKVALFCLAYAMHYKNLYSKTNKIYTQDMYFYGVFMPQKAFASGAPPRRLTPTQEVHLRSLLSASILAFGASLPLVTPIFGYAHVRVSKK